MAEVLIIESDDDDVQFIPSPRRRSARTKNLSASCSSARSRAKGNVEVVCLPSSPVSSDSSMDSPSGPTRKKARTRRGIARRGSKDNNSDLSTHEYRELNIPIYTSQIYLLREKKKQLEADSEIMPSLVDQIDAENISPDFSEETVALTRGRLRKKNQDEPPLVKSVLTASNDSDLDDDVLPPPPPPEMAVKKRRRTKKQKEQEALLRNLQAAREKYEAAKRSEMQNGFYDQSGLDCDVSILEDEVEKEIPIKFRVKSQITRITMKMNQRFHGILPKLSELCTVSAKQLLLSVRDAIIKPEDTPASLGLSIVDIIDCGVAIPATSVASEEETKEAEEADPNRIRLQLQAKDQKSKVTVTIRKGELLCSVMEQYAEKQGLPLEKLTFKFDGETLSPEDTPEDLDLEDDFCIDVIVQT